jgi:predicted transcriptional regulator
VKLWLSLWRLLKTKNNPSKSAERLRKIQLSKYAAAALTICHFFDDTSAAQLFKEQLNAIIAHFLRI